MNDSKRKNNRSRPTGVGVLLNCVILNMFNMFRIRGKGGRFQHRENFFKRNQTEILQLKNTRFEIKTFTSASKQDVEDNNRP